MSNGRRWSLLLPLWILGCGAEGVRSSPPELGADRPHSTDGVGELGSEDAGPCTAGAVRGCYSGLKATQGVGECKAGMQTCTAGVWGECKGEVLPGVESCDGKDNDCNGSVDDAGEPCYSGPAGTEGVGECKAGKQTCSGSGCGGQVLPAAESCDGKDNDCDGKVDEELSRSCYAGPAGTEGVGDCKAGTQTCSNGSWGSCQGEVLPASEACDQRDNDCDGAVDEQLTRSCYAGPAGTEGVGVCVGGTQTCSNGAWAACAGQILPGDEVCDGKDNDCDGAADETLSKSCYSGPAGTAGVGECKSGSQTCSSGSWGSCVGQVLPAPELCDGKDNDCNGTKDGNTQSCYSGPAGTQGVGLCKAGTQTCTLGVWGSCQGQVVPSSELCDGKDNDCDGSVDEALSQSCYSGPAGTLGVGLCKGGTQTCSGGAWSSCSGQVVPVPEVCDNLDNDCNGSKDDGVTRSCYTGPAGTQNVGLCHGGTETCTLGIWGSCAGQVVPVTEVCGDAKDNDCDGSVDEGCTTPCSHSMCVTGAALQAGCGPTTAAVCAADSFCCTSSWDGICVGKVRTVGRSLSCPESLGTCSHSLCTTGSLLVSGCDSAKANCVAQICAVDSYCCNIDWDDICVDEVTTVCKNASGLAYNCNTN